MTKKSAVFLATICAMSISVQNPSHAAVTIYIYEAHGNVEMRGSGTLNLNGLTSAGSPSFSPGIDPSYRSARVGSTATPNADLYQTITGPSFGTKTNTPADAGSGDTFGPGNGALYVPAGYQSGAPLNGSATFLSKTLSDLGAIPGVYVYSWSSDRVTVIIGNHGGAYYQQKCLIMQAC